MKLRLAKDLKDPDKPKTPAQAAGLSYEQISVAVIEDSFQEREKAIRDAFVSAQHTGDVVKVIVGVRKCDMVERQQIGYTASDVSKRLAQAGFGAERDGKYMSTTIDKDQIELFDIDSDSRDRTQASLIDAIERAKRNMERRGVRGRIVVFAPQLDNLELATESAQTEYVSKEEKEYVTVIPDAYSDSEKEGSYADIVVRAAIARHIASYLAPTGNEIKTRDAINDLLARVAEGYEAQPSLEDLLGYLKKHPLRIRPIVCEGIEEYRKWQNAIASSA